jgi:ATP-dependent Clp protease ATP-binding subunit ClpA
MISGESGTGKKTFIKKLIPKIKYLHSYDIIENSESSLELSLKNHLIKVGTDTRFGARILKRTVQKWVDDAITEKILTDNPEKGSTFILTYNEKDKKTDVKIKKPTKRKIKS